MIGHELIPSLFMVEIDGSAVDRLFAPDLNVARVTILSAEFASDVQAAASAQRILDLVCPAGQERVDVNPEFFSLEHCPSAQSDDEPADPKAPAVIKVTRNFDELGDFVGYRKTITGEDFSAKLKVLALPTEYMQARRRELDAELLRSVSEHRELPNKPRLQ